MIYKIINNLNKVIVLIAIIVNASIVLAVQNNDVNIQKPVRVYFAGAIFNQKDLIGNMYLAESLSRLSKGRYDFLLVQNKVQQSVSHKAIRDQDLLGVMNSNLLIISFDGTELDSGTLVEFMLAKELDIPCVIYRTDFRGGSGEENSSFRDNSNEQELGNKWNLMASFYPRTKNIYMNGMIEYQKVYNANQNQSTDVIARLYTDRLARSILSAMDEVMLTKSILSDDERDRAKQKIVRLFDIGV